MQNTKGATTEFLLELGPVEEITAQAQANPVLPKNTLYNSHIHLPPNFSAFETVEQAVSLTAEQGVHILGVGNYYDFSVYETFANKARQKNIFPLFGTEIIDANSSFL